MPEAPRDTFLNAKTDRVPADLVSQVPGRAVRQCGRSRCPTRWGRSGSIFPETLSPPPRESPHLAVKQ